MTLEERLVEKLIQLNYHISFAESCTGGLCCGTIVNVPSASRVLDASFVTYANDAKARLVGVNPDTIAAYGVVSEQVAGEMARGAAKAADCEVGVGITGIAGPTGATAAKPIGMVCFGFCINGSVTTRTMQFGTIGRNNVRRNSVEYALATLLELL